MDEEARKQQRSLTHLMQVAISLSNEKHHEKLLEYIVREAMTITDADGGTLYLLTSDDRLKFKVFLNDSLGVRITDTHRNIGLIDINLNVLCAPIPLYHPEGQPNDQYMSCHVALTREPLNVDDIYAPSSFDLSGIIAFNKMADYATNREAVLTLPLINNKDDLLGILQLVNPLEPDGSVGLFDEEKQSLATTLASLASTAITNRQLMDDTTELLEKFIEVIGMAIDEKSPYTGGHCRRVPEIAMRLARATHEIAEGPYTEFRMTDDQFYEMRIAAMLHDCGKITTPIHVVDKATKLETIFNRFGLIQTRAECLRRDSYIQFLEDCLRSRQLAIDEPATLSPDGWHHHLETLWAIDDDVAFLKQANIGSEFMDPEAQDRIAEIAKRKVRINDRMEPFLADNEVENLQIPKGTLTEDERQVINAHIVTTIRMLDALPFPKHLAGVPEIAGGHHERVDGNGYPNGLTGDQMSPQARMMAIADIFEALTAADRPYKPRMSVSKALSILNNMASSGHIDSDLLHIFINQGVYKDYAITFLHPDQLDNEE